MDCKPCASQISRRNPVETLKTFSRPSSSMRPAKTVGIVLIPSIGAHIVFTMLQTPVIIMQIEPKTVTTRPDASMLVKLSRPTRQYGLARATI